jgi:hypothetical protein
MSTFAILLRDPEKAVHACLSGEGRRELARTSMLSFLVGALLFGGVVGAFRGDLQLIFAAIKMPLLLLGAMVTTVPAVWALGATAERAWPLRAAASLMLVAAGRAALVLAALAPLLWLTMDLIGGYHLSAFLAAAALGVSGLASLSVLLRGMRGMPWGTLALAGCVFGLSLLHSGWVLRPWLVRPGNPEIVFVRTERGVGVLGSLAMSGQRGMHDPRGYESEGAR